MSADGWLVAPTSAGCCCWRLNAGPGHIHSAVAFAGPAHASAPPAALVLPQCVTEGCRYFDFEFTAKLRGATRHALASVTMGNGGWAVAGDGCARRSRGLAGA